MNQPLLFADKDKTEVTYFLYSKENASHHGMHFKRNITN